MRKSLNRFVKALLVLTGMVAGISWPAPSMALEVSTINGTLNLDSQGAGSQEHAPDNLFLYPGEKVKIRMSSFEFYLTLRLEEKETGKVVVPEVKQRGTEDLVVEYTLPFSAKEGQYYVIVAGADAQRNSTYSIPIVSKAVSYQLVTSIYEAAKPVVRNYDILIDNKTVTGSELIVDQPYDVRLRIRNEGDLSVSAFGVAVYLSSDGEYSQDDTWLGDWPLSNSRLAADSENTWNLLDVTPTKPGRFRLVFVPYVEDRNVSEYATPQYTFIEQTDLSISITSVIDPDGRTIRENEALQKGLTYTIRLRTENEGSEVRNAKVSVTLTAYEAVSGAGVPSLSSYVNLDQGEEDNLTLSTGGSRSLEFKIKVRDPLQPGGSFSSPPLKEVALLQLDASVKLPQGSPDDKDEEDNTAKQNFVYAEPPTIRSIEIQDDQGKMVGQKSSSNFTSGRFDLEAGKNYTAVFKYVNSANKSVGNFTVGMYALDAEREYDSEVRRLWQSFSNPNTSAFPIFAERKQSGLSASTNGETKLSFSVPENLKDKQLSVIFATMFTGPENADDAVWNFGEDESLSNVESWTFNIISEAVPEPDLSVTIQSVLDPGGRTIREDEALQKGSTYTIRVRTENNGDAEARNVKVSVSLTAYEAVSRLGVPLPPYEVLGEDEEENLTLSTNGSRTSEFKIRVRDPLKPLSSSLGSSLKEVELLQLEARVELPQGSPGDKDEEDNTARQNFVYAEPPTIRSIEIQDDQGKTVGQKSSGEFTSGRFDLVAGKRYTAVFKYVNSVNKPVSNFTVGMYGLDAIRDYDSEVRRVWQFLDNPNNNVFPIYVRERQSGLSGLANGEKRLQFTVSENLKDKQLRVVFATMFTGPESADDAVWNFGKEERSSSVEIWTFNIIPEVVPEADLSVTIQSVVGPGGQTIGESQALQQGSTYTVRVGVENKGDAVARNVKVSVSLRAHQDVDSQGVPFDVGELLDRVEKEVSSIAPKSQVPSPLEFTIRVEDPFGGTSSLDSSKEIKSLILRADASMAGGTEDRNEEDNFRTIAFAFVASDGQPGGPGEPGEPGQSREPGQPDLPNLVITGHQFKSTVEGGEWVQVEIEVTNVGQEDTSPFTVSVWRTRSGSEGREVGKTKGDHPFSKGLQANGGKASEIVWLDLLQERGKSFNLIAFADPDARVEESNENDNERLLGAATGAPFISEDEQEPNNSSSQANRLVHRNLTIHDSNDEDWFVFDVNPEKTYTVAATRTDVRQELEVEIYDSDNVQNALTSNITNKSSVETEYKISSQQFDTNKGYVRVSGSPGAYRLRIDEKASLAAPLPSAKNPRDFDGLTREEAWKILIFVYPEMEEAMLNKIGGPEGLTEEDVAFAQLLLDKMSDVSTVVRIAEILYKFSLPWKWSGGLRSPDPQGTVRRDLDITLLKRLGEFLKSFGVKVGITTLRIVGAIFAAQPSLPDFIVDPRAELGKPNGPRDALRLNSDLRIQWMERLGMIASKTAGVNVPHRSALLQSYPNPFNPSTTISYQVSEQREVSLVIYNFLGQAVRTLVRKNQAPGVYRVLWDGRDEKGRAVSSGIYIYRLMSGKFVQSRRMLLLK